MDADADRRREGHPNYGNAVIFDTVYWNALANPSNNCAGVPKNEVYNAETNPAGVRCTLADYMINVFGPRPESVWTATRRSSATASPGCRSTTSASSSG